MGIFSGVTSAENGDIGCIVADEPDTSIRDFEHYTVYGQY